MNKVVVHLWGGLGNQLFLYSFGEYLRYRYGQNVFYDLSSYGATDIRHLEVCEIVGQLPEFSTNKRFFTRHTGIYRRLSRVLFKLRPGVHYEFDCFNEALLSRNYRILYLDGYWQDCQYADWLKMNKPELFTLTLPIPPEVKRYESLIKNRDTISIHIRRGDYLLPKNAHLNVCTSDYYLQAEKKASIGGGVTNVVFSDDIEWVKKNLGLKNDSIYVKLDSLSSFWDMYLMSCCSRHIISNSTFSWWGAFLDDKQNKLVVAPSKWRNDKDNPPLYYKEWELIE